ncbi:hypothetical protein FRX31_006396 [Thalictrum thalictroides]|uniref:Uncharacterized protein n=1 Tax=Thalictrum thalictroides TaxID=46969 RepID=A0A7J6X4M5_THATH|nr:hypothetical protein FRX31_006396 [Thalictrum thalictroides]
MNSDNKVSSYIILLFIFFIATAHGIDSTQPNDLPWVGLACEFIKCGEGKCVPSTGNNTLLPFDCECNSGWKKIEIGGLTYPACVIPNCTIDFNCGTATPPAPPGSLLPPLANLTGRSLGADCTGVGFGTQPPPPPPPSAASNRNGPNSSSRTQYSLSMLLLAAIFISML